MKGRFNLNIIGNLFYLDKNIKFDTIYKSLLLTLIIGFLSYFLEGNIFSISITLKNFFYIILGVSFFYLLTNYKIIVNSFKNYFRFNLVTIMFGFMEFILAVSLILVYNKEIFGWILGIFWLFSGFLRILIQATPALFKINLKDFIKLIQIFAYTRASYFSFIEILILTIVPKNPFSGWFLFLLIMFLVNLWLISNLNPYMLKHSSVKNAVILIRTIGDNKEIKFNRLKEKMNMSEEDITTIIKRWDHYNLINMRGNRVMLSSPMEYIKN